MITTDYRIDQALDTRNGIMFSVSMVYLMFAAFFHHADT